MAEILVDILSKKNLVIYSVFGEFSELDILNAFDEAIESPDYRAEMNRLWDFRKGTAVKGVNLRKIIGHIAKHSKSGITYTNSILVSGDFEFGMGRMYQSLSGDLPAKVLITKDPVKAFEKVGLVYSSGD